MKKRNYSLKFRIMLTCILLGVIPVLIIGISSIMKFNAFTKASISKSYKGLEEQAYTIIKSIVDNDLEKINNIISKADELTQRFAYSSNITKYLNAKNIILFNTKTDLSNFTYSIKDMCNVQYKMLMEKKTLGLYCLNYVTELLARPFLMTSQEETWEPVNQYSNENKLVNLPVMYFGSNPIEKIYSYDEFSPVVDDVQEMTGVDCIIFQKINDQGDMLRIASSVRNKNNKRDIETFMPVLLPDNTNNPILSTIKNGDEFIGISNEGNENYFSTYKPFYNDSGKLIGAYFIGVPTKNDSFYNSILDKKLEKSMYVFIINAKGDLVLHPRPELINKNVIKDLNLDSFEEVISNYDSSAVKFQTYTFENKQKYMSYLYFKPRKWIICVTTFIDDIITEKIDHALMVLKDEIHKLYSTNKVKIKNDEFNLISQIRLFDSNGLEHVRLINGEFSNKLNSKFNSDWFIQNLKKPKGTISSSGVIISKNTGETEIRLSTPIFINDQAAGLLVINFKWDIINKLISNRSFGNSGFCFIINENKVFVSHPSYSLKDNIFFSDSSYYEQLEDTNYENINYKFKGSKNLIYMAPFICGEKEYNLCASGKKDDLLYMANNIKKDSQKAHKEILSIILLLLSICSVLSIIIGIMVARRIIKPLEKVVNYAQNVSMGDLSQTLKTRNEDEIGFLLSAINTIVISYSKIVGNVKMHASKLSNSSTKIVKIAGVFADNFEQMSKQANNVTDTSIQMSSETHKIASSIKDMSLNVNNVTSTTEQISQNINNMSISIDEMSKTLTILGSQAQMGAEITEKAVQIAEDTNTKMILLDKAANEIGVVSQLIKRVAYKTNVIAMNADIEASSAGKEGKGFAVVAKTIKDFAKQNKKSAEYINTKITSVQKSTTEAMSALEGMLSIIKEINLFVNSTLKSMKREIKNADSIASYASESDSGIKNIVGAMANLSDSASRISENVHILAKGADEVVKIIKNASSATNNSTEGVNLINKMALELDQFAIDLKKLVSGFRIIQEDRLLIGN